MAIPAVVDSLLRKQNIQYDVEDLSSATELPVDTVQTALLFNDPLYAPRGDQRDAVGRATARLRQQLELRTIEFGEPVAVMACFAADRQAGIAIAHAALHAQFLRAREEFQPLARQRALTQLHLHIAFELRVAGGRVRAPTVGRPLDAVACGQREAVDAGQARQLDCAGTRFGGGGLPRTAHRFAAPRAAAGEQQDQDDAWAPVRGGNHEGGHYNVPS